MMALLTWAAKATLLLTAALIIGRWRRISAATRHALLCCALLCTPGLWVVQQMAPIPLLPVPAPAILIDYAATVAATMTPAEQTAAASSPVWDWLSLTLAAYATIVMLLISGTVVRLMRAYRFLRALPVIRQAPVPVRQGPDNGTPCAWGLWNACVVVPGQWHRWPGDKQRSVMLHERAHLTRGDALTSVLNTLVCALLWIHPLVWLVRRRAAVLAEQACDDLVISQGVGRANYATHLLQISKMRSQNAMPGMTSPSTLSARIRAVVDETTRRNPMSLQKMLTLLSSSLLVLTILGGINARADTASLSTNMTHRLVAIQVHIDDGALDDARRMIADLSDAQDLSPAERAQMTNLSAYVHYLLGDYPKAIADYEQVIAHAPQIPTGLQQTTLYTLAQLNFVQADYRQAIAYMQQWMEEVQAPGPIPHVFIAQTYYQMNDYPAALQALERGLALAREQGSEINPNWLKLRDFLTSEDAGAVPPRHLGLDGDYLPVVKVAPVYPQAARKERIEGFVVVEFSVGSNGLTQQARVVEASPPDIFDRAALAAVSKFRYKPRVVDGDPVAVTGVRNRITFVLNDG